MALLTDTLHRFDLKQSDDPVKTDLELTCSKCGEVLCDVEPDDNLGVLASVADDHVCKDGDEIVEPCEVDDCDNTATPCACGAAHCTEHPHDEEV